MSSAELARVQASPILARVTHYPGPFERYYDARLTLPGCLCGFQIDENHNEPEANLTPPRESKAIATGLAVSHGLRRQYVGTRLLKAGLALAKEYSAIDFSAYVESPWVLYMLRNVFGEQALTIMHDSSDGYPQQPLPITIDQAVASFDITKSYENNDKVVSDIGFVVTASLLALDTVGWELPRVIETSVELY